MSVHPPWLRFQAYVVGLPKTGSTSLATLFGRYRSAHEWELRELLGPALARRQGALDDEGFLQAVGRRLVPPALEMDSTTCHYLYADLLRDRFPQAVFYHTIRDVRSWVSSLLDMVVRKRLARRIVEIPYTGWGKEYFLWMTEGLYNLDPHDSGDDRSSVIPLMRQWSQHMRDMAAQLPAGRSLQVRTRELGDRILDIADLAGVDASTLRADLSHANQAPLRFDRFAVFDSEELRAAYEEHCMDLMKELFPKEHTAWWHQSSQTKTREAQNREWEAYLQTVSAWIEPLVAQFGPQVAK